MAKLTVDVKVYCNNCGKDMEKLMHVVSDTMIDLDPCPNCMGKMYNDGYAEGYNDAEKEA